MSRSRYYKIEGDKITDNSTTPHEGWTKIEFEDKQTYYDWGNISRLKVVDSSIVMKSQEEMDTEEAAKILTAKPIEVWEALKAEGYDDELLAAFEANPSLKMDWEVDHQIELDDPDVQQALASMGLGPEAIAALQLQIHQSRKASQH